MQASEARTCWQDLQAQEGEDEQAGQEGEPITVLEGQPRPTDRPRMTSRYMTKYERARVLGTRALQIRSGAPGPNPAELAVLEQSLCSTVLTHLKRS